MDACYILSINGVGANIMEFLSSEYGRVNDKRKTYMTLLNFNLLIATLGTYQPKYDFFNDLSPLKSKLYFELVQDVTTPLLYRIKLIYDAPVNRMGIKIKKRITQVLIANNFSGKQDFYTSRITSKSYFFL